MYYLFIGVLAVLSICCVIIPFYFMTKRAGYNNVMGNYTKNNRKMWTTAIAIGIVKYSKFFKEAQGLDDVYIKDIQSFIKDLIRKQLIVFTSLAFFLWNIVWFNKDIFPMTPDRLVSMYIAGLFVVLSTVCLLCYRKYNNIKKDIITHIHRERELLVSNPERMINVKQKLIKDRVYMPLRQIFNYNTCSELFHTLVLNTMFYFGIVTCLLCMTIVLYLRYGG